MLVRPPSASLARQFRSLERDVRGGTGDPRAGALKMISMAQAPERVAKYEVMEEIGSGGMATVFRARDPRLDREVALKLIHRHLRQSTEVAARFNSEARVVAKLRHPNVVEVYDVSDEDDEQRYLVVE